jgi:hypothetical protein
MAEGRLPVERLSGIQLNIESIATVIRALLQSLNNNDDLQELLANVTGGNVRELLQFVTSFIGSPNVDAEKIVKLIKERGTYRIPLHEFSKAALLGDYAHYHAQSSLAMNVFDVRHADPREHFLALLMLAYMDFDGSHREPDGFIDSDLVHDEMQSHGFTIPQIIDCLARLVDRRLVETPHRAILTDEEVAHHGNQREKYRITARGAYHLLKWMPTFGYMDAMSFDTPIFDEDVRDSLLADLESFDISVRLGRAVALRSYLTKHWRSSGIRASYLDFEALLARGEVTFRSVQHAVRSNVDTRSGRS